MDLGEQSVADLANLQIILKGRDACLDVGQTYQQEDRKKINALAAWGSECIGQAIQG